MLAPNIPITTKPCSSCGVTGGSDHRFSCQPGRRTQQGRFRNATRDARNSRAILVYCRIQEFLINGIKDT